MCGIVLPVIQMMPEVPEGNGSQPFRDNLLPGEHKGSVTAHYPLPPRCGVARS